MITFSIVYLIGTLWFSFVEFRVLLLLTDYQATNDEPKLRKHSRIMGFTSNEEWDISNDSIFEQQII